MVNKRPRIQPKLTRSDKVAETVGWFLLLAIWIMTLANYADLPDTIPIHYNAMGEADGFGHKGHLFGLPILATLLFVGMTILNRYPHIFNYGVSDITPDNAEREYARATRLIRYMKLAIVFIYSYIVFETIDPDYSLGAWFLPFTMGLLFAPLIIYLIFKKS